MLILFRKCMPIINYKSDYIIKLLSLITSVKLVICYHYDICNQRHLPSHFDINDGECVLTYTHIQYSTEPNKTSESFLFQSSCFLFCFKYECLSQLFMKINYFFKPVFNIFTKYFFSQKHFIQKTSFIPINNDFMKTLFRCSLISMT